MVEHGGELKQLDEQNGGRECDTKLYVALQLRAPAKEKLIESSIDKTNAPARTLQSSLLFQPPKLEHSNFLAFQKA